MNSLQIARARTHSQGIAGAGLKSEDDVVSWLVALQAQDYGMAKWGIGVRMRGTTDRSVQAAVDNGKIVRTHLLRPTWHFVSARDVRWLLELTAPQIKSSLRGRHRDLELTEAIVKRSNRLMAKAVAHEKHLTRPELVAVLERAGISTRENRASHLLLRAELDKVICSGPTRAGKPTYALFEERVPDTSPLKKEEALARLAEQYFVSRCPATFHDFLWWSGLRVGDARKALESVKAGLHPEKINSQIYWLPNDYALPASGADSIHLLPAFDEIIISYKDRNDSLVHKDRIKAVSNNGVFRPTVVLNGRVIGIWRRNMDGEKTIVEVEAFRKLNQDTRHQLGAAIASYELFLGKAPNI